MWKRLWKNAILALCVLAMVLQPVSVFASDLTYNSFANFRYALNTYYYNRFLDVDNFSETPYGTIQGLLYNASEYVNYSHDYIFTVYRTSSNSNYITGFILKRNDVKLVKRGLGVISAYFLNNSDYYMFQVADEDIPTADAYNMTFTPYSKNAGTYQGTVCNSIDGYVGIWNYDNYYIYGGSSNNSTIEFKFILDSSSAYNSYLPSDNPVTPNYPEEASSSFMEYYLFQFINSNFYYRQGNSFLNANWIPVGQFLTYDYLCKSNIDSETVTFYDELGNSVTLDNYLYASTPHDYSSTLSSIDSKLSTTNSNLSTISSRVNTTNTRLNTLNTSINTQMNAVNNKLNAAFPSDQAAINDFIAEDLMDDTGGNGLTINRIASSKSDLDDGLDTFKLDTSQSQYSNPFSALNDADWSFWSQTTLNNLGSGYSYSFGEGSLMSEDDVFTENQNNLLNLLGW